MFVDGIRRSSALIAGPTTIHLGAADGIPVSLVPGDPVDATTAVVTEHDEDNRKEFAETDPDVARAGKAVAARRRELGITQRSLPRDKVINAGALIAFEKGRSWPRRGTLAKLEEVLNWSPGTIGRIRNGTPVAQSGEPTEVLTDTVHAPLMAGAVAVGHTPSPRRWTRCPIPPTRSSVRPAQARGGGRQRWRWRSARCAGPTTI